jgi:hypothetical protein
MGSWPANVPAQYQGFEAKTVLTARVMVAIKAQKKLRHIVFILGVWLIS